MLDKIVTLPFLSSLTIEAAVSSQLLSIPKKNQFFAHFYATSRRLIFNTNIMKNNI